MVPIERITSDPAMMGGQPCIRGLHIPVRTVQRMLDSGMSPEEIVHDLPDLELDDVEAARLVDIGPEPDFVGMGDSGQSDVSERVDEHLKDGFGKT